MKTPRTFAGWASLILKALAVTAITALCIPVLIGTIRIAAAMAYWAITGDLEGGTFCGECGRQMP